MEEINSHQRFTHTHTHTLLDVPCCHGYSEWLENGTWTEWTGVRSSVQSKTKVWRQTRLLWVFHTAEGWRTWKNPSECCIFLSNAMENRQDLVAQRVYLPVPVCVSGVLNHRMEGELWSAKGWIYFNFVSRHKSEDCGADGPHKNQRPNMVRITAI